MALTFTAFKYPTHNIANVEKDKKYLLFYLGSNFALSLTLNVEQYEYMKGPENDAGVKVIVDEKMAFVKA